MSRAGARASQDNRGRINTRKLSTSVIMVVQQRQNRWTIDAESKWLSAWNAVLLVAIIHAVFCVSFVVSFQLYDDVHATHDRLDFLELLFAIDIVVNMHTTFYESGNVVMELWRTRAKYLCSPAFVLDVIPLLPLRRCFAPDPIATVGKCVDLLKIIRLLRLPKCILHVEHLLAKYFTLVKRIKIVGACIAVSHVLACVRGWYYPNDHNDHGRRLSGSSGDPWIPIPSTTPGRDYLASAFWSFGILSGLFEGELPRTINASLLTLVVMLSGLFLFPYICGTFSMISKCTSQRTEAFDAKRNQLKYIMAYHRVPNDVQQRAIDYIVHEHNTGEALDREYLAHLTPSIVRDIKVAVHEKMLSQVPLFRPCSPHFIHAIVALMDSKTMPANCVVCCEGDDADAMYFVQTGVLLLTKAHVREPKELRKGMYFGEFGLVAPQVRHHTVTTATYCILTVLTRANAAVVLAAYPHWAGKLKDTAAKLLALDTRRTRHHQDLADISQVAAVGVKRSKWTLLLGCHTIHRHGDMRLGWLVGLQLIQLYHVVSVPLHVCFPAIHFSGASTAINTIVDACLWLDMYANLHLSYIQDAEHIVDVVQCARHYLHSTALLHLLSTFPWWILAPSYPGAAVRLPRLLRLWDVSSQLDEISHHVTLDGPKRTALLCLLLLATYHLTSCMYFCMTEVDGFSSRPGQDWLPPVAFKLAPWNATHMVDGLNETHEIGSPSYRNITWNQYSHSFYYAASVITSLGRGIEPDTVHQYMFHYVFMVFGFIFMAYIIDEVQKGITASAVEQVAFLSRRANILWFLQQQHVPPHIHRRVNSFLEFWWSAHRGADINALLSPLPLQTRRDILSHVCHAVLARFQLLRQVTNDPIAGAALFGNLSAAFLDAIHIRLYGQDETIFTAGDYANGTYFLVEGRVVVDKTPPRRVAIGMPFGLAALDVGSPDAIYYKHTTVALSGCIVAFLSQGGISTLLQLMPTFVDELQTRDLRVASQTQLVPSVRWPTLATNSAAHLHKSAIDPDAPVVILWELCTFVGMSYQCIGVPFRMAFGRSADVSSTDSVVMALEVFFLLDMVLRLHLGYYEYGNKVMDPRVIRQRYVRSLACLMDVLAILPLQLVNWVASSDIRSESWNANKLVRMYKLSSMLSRFEQRFVTLNIHVRMFQLLLYTFFLSHWVGCIWFNFASNETNLSTSTAFGLNSWLPPASLQNKTVTFQYYATLFWGFGTMSGCSPRNLPTTTVERFFNVFGILCGVFLFSYVLGNLADIVKVVDGHNRAFYAKLSTLRLFLTKYRFPPKIEDRIKHYYFYQTFHSIHQESILSACLPPSLVTDTRMFLLQPIMDQVEFLQGTDPHSRQAIRMVVSLLVQQLIPRGKVICKQGDIGLEMFFVYAGCLDVLVTETIRAPSSRPKLAASPSIRTQRMESVIQMFQRATKTAPTPRPLQSGSVSMRFSDASSMLQATNGTIHVKVNEILPGSFFGEASLFSDKPRNANIQARTFCTVYTLSRQHLHAVFKLHPTWKESVLNTVNGYQKDLQTKTIVAKVTTTLAASVKENRRRSSAVATVANVARKTSASFTAVLDALYPKTTTTVTTRSIRSVARRLMRIEVQSPLYIRWLQVLSVCIVYQALYVPYTICFNVAIESTAVMRASILLNIVTDAAFAFDIWFRLHLVANDTSLEFYEGAIAGRGSYRWPAKAVDVLCVLPLDYVGYAAIDAAIGRHALYFLRLNRCAKLVRLPHALSEITRLSLANDVNFLRKLVAVYLCIIYWVGCLYFCLTYVDGYGDDWHSWLPVKDFEAAHTAANDIHRLLRAMYFSTGIFTNTGASAFRSSQLTAAVGVTLLPTTVYEYVFVIGVCLCCLFLTSYFIGQVSTMFVCLTQHEVEFRIHEMYTESYIGRTPLKTSLRLRLYKFLNYWWHAHRGVRHDDILQELPPEIKGHAMVFMAHNALTTFVTTFFAPLRAEPGELDMLRFRIACGLRLEIYPHDEYVIVEGDIATTMYFVVSGSLLTTHHNNSTAIHRYREGHFFGETNFLTAPCAPASVKTLRACELLALPATGLVDAMDGVPHFKQAYQTVVEMYGGGNKDDVAIESIGAKLKFIHPTFLHGTVPTTDRDYWDAFRRFLHLVHVSHAKEIELDASAAYKFLDCSCCHGAVATIMCPICRANFCTGCNFLVHLNTEREAHLEETKPIHAARRLFIMYYFAKRWKLRAQQAIAARKAKLGQDGPPTSVNEHDSRAEMCQLLETGFVFNTPSDADDKDAAKKKHKLQSGRSEPGKRTWRPRLQASPSASHGRTSKCSGNMKPGHISSPSMSDIPLNSAAVRPVAHVRNPRVPRERAPPAEQSLP